jgi:hypothetical protein
VAKKPESPIYAFRRSSNSLVPDMEFDMDALTGISEGERVRVEIRQWRNSGRNRAYWKMLSEVVSGNGLSLTPEKLHEVLKLENGVVDLVRLPSGMTVAIPGSISFEKMTEQEFVDFFRKAEAWLAETYGWVREEAA